ncbi:tyrosine aminotransferase-like [Ostrinia nubilalis]|uniref:tyrosine aminotransferase-like n=1 Tax=Ostrinia nubilalis TaxID=29057 RepID=UPI0030824C17
MAGQGTERPWQVRATFLARNTNNLIRNVIENLKVQPNPEKKLIPLSLGDPTVFGNITPPEELLQAVRDSIDNNKSRTYGPTNGQLEARQAVADYSIHQGRVTADDVILTSGCAHALELAITVLAEDGQNILVPRPGYMIYMTLAEGLGIQIKYYDLLPEQKWKVDLESLQKQIDDKTAAIVVINPSNPCGSVYSEEHLLEILDIASRNRVPIIADEIYEHFVFSGHKYTAMSALSKDVPILTCSGLTKRFLVPGWRMGWLIVHDRNYIFGKEIRQGLRNLCGRLLGPTTLIQHALPSILTSMPQHFFDGVMSFMESQAKLACEALQRAPGLRPIMPQGSMYMMIEIKVSMFSEFQNDLQFIERLYSEQSVLCIPGQCFYYPNFMRIVLTVPEEILREACQRIIAFCKDHATPKEKHIEMITNKLSVDKEWRVIY